MCKPIVTFSEDNSSALDFRLGDSNSELPTAMNGYQAFFLPGVPLWVFKLIA
jgi:hypothetical protein